MRALELNVLVLALAVTIVACEGSMKYPIPFETYRHIQPVVWVVQDSVASEYSWTAVSGAAPLSVALALGVGWKDGDGGRRPDEMIPKIEVDFGDGSGWQDFSELYYVMDFDYDDGVDLSRVLRHTYTMAGTYQIYARATFWDGEVVKLDQSTPPSRPQPISINVSEPQG